MQQTSSGAAGIPPRHRLWIVLGLLFTVAFVGIYTYDVEVMTRHANAVRSKLSASASSAVKSRLTQQSAHAKRRDFVTLQDIQLVGSSTAAAAASLRPRDEEPSGSAAASRDWFETNTSGTVDARKKSLDRADKIKEPCFSPTDKLFVCMSSYGEKERAEYVKSILGNFEELKVRYGMEVQAFIHVTEVPPLKSRFLSDAVEYRLGDPTLKLHFSGLCRHDFKKSLESNAHTHYLLLEDDMNVTASHLTNLCEQFRYLDTFPRARILFPGLLRYENKPDINGANHRVLTDNPLCCPPQISEVLDIGGLKYIAPKNPYAALYFLPAKHYKDLLKLKLKSINYDFYATDISPWTGLVREEHAGLWFRKHTTKVVPLDTAQEFLVHHIPDNYAFQLTLPTIEKYIESAQGYNGVPITLANDGMPVRV